MRYWCGSISGSGGFGWLPALAVVAAAAWYGASVLKLQRRGGSWPLSRMISAGIGAAVAVAVTQGPIEGSAMQRFSVHSVQHVALGMFVPLCIVAAAPLTLALRTSQPSTRRRLRNISGSVPVRIVSHPAVTLPIYLATMVAVFFTPVFPAMMNSHVAHQAFNAHLLVAGTMFAWPLVGADPSPHRIAYPARMGLVFLSLPLHSVGIMALLSASTLVGGASAQRAAGIGGFDALADQRMGASLMWVLGEVVGITAVGLAARRWFVADRSATRARLRRGPFGSASANEGRIPALRGGAAT
jgi:putative copper resistance protein D